MHLRDADYTYYDQRLNLERKCETEVSLVWPFVVKITDAISRIRSKDFRLLSTGLYLFEAKMSYLKLIVICVIALCGAYDWVGLNASLFLPVNVSLFKLKELNLKFPGFLKHESRLFICFLVDRSAQSMNIEVSQFYATLYPASSHFKFLFLGAFIFYYRMSRLLSTTTSISMTDISPGAKSDSIVLTTTMLPSTCSI